jgi:3-oxoacyl-[acyl-carrier-protein] synthase-1
VSSLGQGADSTAAAIRAGLTRRTPIDFDGPEVYAHPAIGYADRFIHGGAWIRLGLGAVEDAFTGGPEDARARILGNRFGLWTAGPLPDPDRLVDDAYQDQAVAFAGGLIRELGGNRPAFVEGLALGHCGAAEALRRIATTMEQNALDRALLVASDSYVDPLSVEWLFACNRLKTDDQPCGLDPGQAGAALVLERRAASAPAFVEAAEVAGQSTVADEWTAPSPPALGACLAGAILRAIGGAGGPPYRGLLILDLNGEPWKAETWGHAQVALQGRVDLTACPVFLPAASVGETGAASAVLGIQLAMHLAARGARSEATALVCSLSDDGRASVVRLSLTTPTGC